MPSARAEQIQRTLPVGLSLAAIALLISVGAVRYASDAAFFTDESVVALSIRDMGARDLLGLLVAKINFPRLYLIAIDATAEIFGYETAVVRLLPFLFFAAATAAWIALLHARFRLELGVLSIGLLLNFVPTTWPVMGAMLKQYSFDTFCALVPFLLSDRFYARALQRGEKRSRLLLIALPCALSYTYIFALAGRTGGWLAVRMFAARKERFRLDARAAVVLGSATAMSLGTLWLTDVRHTVELTELVDFWQPCVLGGTQSNLGLIDRFLFGWYDGRQAFIRQSPPPGAVIVALEVLFFVGVAGVAIGLRKLPSGAGNADERAWGTRSQGALLMVLALLAAAPILGYPVCAGRLTLFTLFALQLLLLEGVSLVGRAAQRVPRGKVLTAIFGTLLCALIAPAAVRNTTATLQTPPPGDIRLLRARMDRAPLRPVIVDPCSGHPVMALPEGLGNREVLYATHGGDVPVPSGAEAWVISVVHPKECRPFMRALEERAQLKQLEGWPAPRLYLARFGAQPER